MTNTLLWLTYLASGAIALALVYAKAWRLVPSMIAATAFGTLASLLIMLAIPASEDDENYWFQVDLAMNASMSLIFAGAGGAIGYALREARGHRRGERSSRASARVPEDNQGE